MPEPSIPTALPGIVAQHADEAAFLWRLREGATHASHYTLTDLADLEGRIEAHLDGLRIAGEAGRGACREEMPIDPGAVFSTTVLALEDRSADAYFAALSAADTSDAHERAFVTALVWVPFEDAAPILQRLLSAEPPNQCRFGLAACAGHRHDPGEALADALRAPDADLCLRALQAAGELGRLDLLRPLQEAVRDAAPEHQLDAAWSSARLGDSYALDALRDLVYAPDPCPPKALDLLVRRQRLSQSRETVRWLMAQPARLRDAIRAAGAAGDPAIVQWLIEQMDNPDLARLAADALCTITGLDLSDANLDGDAPDGFEAGPNDDPDDADVAPDPDEDLPWPDAERIAAWWQAERGAFQLEVRHLLGRPIDDAGLQRTLQIGTQPQRAAAAVELAILQPEHPLFNTTAPARRQRHQLGLPHAR